MSDRAEALAAEAEQGYEVFAGELTGVPNRLLLALGNPGVFTDRRTYGGVLETEVHWQARAVMKAGYRISVPTNWTDDDE